MLTLLNIFSRTHGTARFEESVNKHRNFEWEKVELPVYPGNTHRWEHLPKGLTGQIIFTDTDDVVLQGKVPELTGIITAPEGVLHKDTIWKDQCVGEYEPLLDKSVYNAGMFQMPAEYIYELADFILSHKGNDQLSFNLWLLSHKHDPNLAMFLPLYDNMKIAQKKDGIWSIGGIVPRFVHANGRKIDANGKKLP